MEDNYLVIRILFIALCVSTCILYANWRIDKEKQQKDQ